MLNATASFSVSASPFTSLCMVPDDMEKWYKLYQDQARMTCQRKQERKITIEAFISYTPSSQM